MPRTPAVQYDQRNRSSTVYGWATAFKNLDFKRPSGVLRGTKLQGVLIRGSNIKVSTMNKVNLVKKTGKESILHIKAGFAVFFLSQTMQTTSVRGFHSVKVRCLLKSHVHHRIYGLCYECLFRAFRNSCVLKYNVDSTSFWYVYFPLRSVLRNSVVEVHWGYLSRVLGTI